MMMNEFGPESLMLIAGALLSLAFAYVPGLSARYEALASEAKAAVMAGLMLVVAVAVVGLSCYAGAPYAGLPVCDGGLLWRMVQVVVLALLGLAGNQGVYLAGVRPFKKSEL